AAGRIVLQAVAQYGAHVLLRGQERSCKETGRKPLGPARAARLGNAPTQDLPQLPVHLPSPLDVVEVLAIPRFLQKRRTRLAELFSDPPDALRFGFKRHLHDRIAATGPADVLIAMRRGVRKQ